MRKHYELAGQKFGRWTVIERAESKHYKGDGWWATVSYWQCQCECGTLRAVNQTTLLNGGSQSCGCFHKERASETHKVHGGSKQVEYSTWQSMKQRCYDFNCGCYPRYGGRGITVCDRWREDYGAFLEDMGQRPSPLHSIERIANEGNYEPNNCRWATRSEQARNRRSSRLITCDGVTKTLAEWAELTGIGASVIDTRLARGWEVSDALTALAGNPRNRRTTHWITYEGETKSIAEWAELKGLDYGCLKSRITKLGWTIERAMMTPSR